jgi:hypothetical protein
MGLFSLLAGIDHKYAISVRVHLQRNSSLLDDPSKHRKIGHRRFSFEKLGMGNL